MSSISARSAKNSDENPTRSAPYHMENGANHSERESHASDQTGNRENVRDYSRRVCRHLTR